MLKELVALVKDQVVRDAYKKALRINPLNAVQHMELYLNFDNANEMANTVLVAKLEFDRPLEQIS
jgi:hypothetical protein